MPMHFEEKLRDLGIDSQQLLHFFATGIRDISMVSENSDSSAWSTGAGHPAVVRDLFLFETLLDAVCFAHCNQQFLVRPDQIVMAAVGSPPGRPQVQQLTSRYQNAEIHTVFPADCPGAVADCKVALYASKNDGQFFFFDGKIMFTCQQASYEFDEYNFSLSKFQKRLGLTPLVQAHKPKGGYNSFFQVLKK